MSGHRLIVTWMVICPLVLIFCLVWWVMTGPLPTPMVWLAWAALVLLVSTLAAIFVELVWETDHPPFAPAPQPSALTVVEPDGPVRPYALPAVLHDDPYWYSSGWDEDDEDDEDEDNDDDDDAPALPQAAPELVPAPDPRAGWSRWDYVLSEIGAGRQPEVQS